MLPDRASLLISIAEDCFNPRHLSRPAKSSTLIGCVCMFITHAHIFLYHDSWTQICTHTQDLKNDGPGPLFAQMLSIKTWHHHLAFPKLFKGIVAYINFWLWRKSEKIISIIISCLPSPPQCAKGRWVHWDKSVWQKVYICYIWMRIGIYCSHNYTAESFFLSTFFHFSVTLRKQALSLFLHCI